MWIVLLALRRPYTFVVAALLLVILTPFILLRMPTDIFPSIDIPVVSIIWQYSGLDAKQMEERIVYADERVLTTTVNNIDHIESTSYNGIGVIKVYFQPKVSVDLAVAQITAVCQTIIKAMPPGVTPPLIVQYNASTVPVLQYSLSSPKLSEQQLNDIAVNQVRVGLVTVPGAVIPYPYGGKNRVVEVDLNLAALKAKNIQPSEVVGAINAQNLVLPSGTAKIGATEFAVSVDANTRMIDELNDLPIKTVNGATVYIRDVAQVHDGYTPQQNAVREDGVRGTLLTILKAGNASTLDVVSGIKAALPRVLATVSSDLHVQEFADQSLFVRAAIKGVLREGIIAAALTALMILLFLGSWRSTFIIALSIPLSVLCSIAILCALGETINLMTLGGMALAVGILVDDATVAIENIHRHMASGQPLDESIIKGSQEIAIPAFVSTLCICIVFVPMFFLTGVAHYLFLPLAEAVVFAILASYVISRTLVPTLVMWFYRNVQMQGEAHGEHINESNVPFWLRPFARFQSGFEQGFDRFRNGYRGLLASCFEHRKVFAGVFLVFCILSWLLVVVLGRNFFPTVDAGQFLLHVRGPTGMRIEETERFCGEVNALIHDVIPSGDLGGILDNIGIPNSSINLSYNSSGIIGANDADVLVSLKPGHAATETYIRALREQLAHRFPGDLFYFLPADIVSQTLNFGLPAPFDIQVIGRDPKNHNIAVRLADEIKKIPGAVDVRVNQPNNLPQLTVEVERIKAAQLGLAENDVANAILLGLSGTTQVQPVYWLDPKLGIQYLIDVYAPQYAINSVAELNAMPVRIGQGDDQILANVATIKREEVPPVVSHYDVLPVTDVYGGVDGSDLGSVMNQIRPLVKEAKKNLPRGTSIEIRGQVETMLSSYVGLGVGLVMAIILIYFLLVVNFQSWLDPFIIITALPGALAGVVWGLFLTQTTLSVPALMGAIMSMGVATANSVLVVSFARENLRGGMDSVKAALEAGIGRIRPVIMTALAMIIGMAPMSLGMGEGGEQNAPLGRAVIGGLIMATIATLLFVPVVFSFMHRHYHAPTIIEKPKP
jgi:multidrug efflux pump subunit AcrB